MKCDTLIVITKDSNVHNRVKQTMTANIFRVPIQIRRKQYYANKKYNISTNLLKILEYYVRVELVTMIYKQYVTIRKWLNNIQFDSDWRFVNNAKGYPRDIVLASTITKESFLHYKISFFEISLNS